MTKPSPFNIMKAPLTGINLVEASAGTGKTWNIEAITVRLMAEKWMLPGDILVVTFTEAATQELRERIYKRLIEVIRILKSPEERTTDTFLLDCRKKYGAGSGSISGDGSDPGIDFRAGSVSSDGSDPGIDSRAGSVSGDGLTRVLIFARVRFRATVLTRVLILARVRALNRVLEFVRVRTLVRALA
jgi:hypothetical protein